jgi:CubicO group peptidase (beta-lactamase class C family)
MNRGLLRLRIVVLTILFFLAACSPAKPYLVPEQVNDGWQTATLNEVGIDEKLIFEAVAGIEDGTYPNIHSLLIVKDGKLVFEEYFDGYVFEYNDPEFKGEWIEYRMDTPHNLASVTKSFTSALVGIAIDQSFITGVDDRVFTFFPEYADLRNDQNEAITLEHLLTMTPGFAWNEMELPYSDTNNDLVYLFIAPDPIEYILSKPLMSEPGTKWYYNGGGTNVLGEVIRETTGMRMDDFAEVYLFGQLGITDYEWDFINPDMVHASGNLFLRPRDMAKFGALYLNDGVWAGEQVLSPGWIEASTSKHTQPRWADGYGYQWWLRTYHAAPTAIESYFASGWGGQRIAVFPSLNMVVVFTGGNYVGDEPVDLILGRHILPAVIEGD